MVRAGDRLCSSCLCRTTPCNPGGNENCLLIDCERGAEGRTALGCAWERCPVAKGCCGWLPPPPEWCLVWIGELFGEYGWEWDMGDVVADTEDGNDVMDDGPYWLLASLFVLLKDEAGVVRRENGDERPDICWCLDCWDWTAEFGWLWSTGDWLGE